MLFHVDSQIDEEDRLDDVRDITLSYTFFEIEPSDRVKTSSDSSVNIESLN